MSSAKILLAEDDENLGYILKEYLEMKEYQVTLARDGEEGLAYFQQSNYDLCLLDVMMPKKDGFTLATEIRAMNTSIPIIFLTAKALKVDKLKGFKIGADDYIVKPVDEEELDARIRAIIKRSSPTSENVTSNYEIGNYQFDYANLRLSLNGEVQQMTQKEGDMLKALCDHQGNILDRQSTLKSLWGESDYFNRRSMDVFISRLRKYLSKDPSITIRNVHGKGFVLEVRK
ncbi:MAG: response regulator transcription factor [Bacteroidota bacterium]